MFFRRACFVFIFLYFLTPTISAGNGSHESDWPQWRGKLADGVAYKSKAPLNWSSDSSNVLWKTPLPGEGLSSPVIISDRIFVTTAYEESRPQPILRGFVAKGILLLAAFLVFAVGRQFANRRQDRLPDNSGIIHYLDRIAVSVGTVVFGGLCVLLALERGYLPTAVENIRLLGVSLLRAAGRHETHLSYLKWNETNPDSIWVITGGIALLGIVTAVGFCRTASIWRLLSVLAVVPCIAALTIWIPVRPGFREPFGFQETVMTTLPATLLATWFVFAYFATRLANKSGDTFRRSTPYAAMIILVALATLVFAPRNFLYKPAGYHRVVLCLDRQDGHVIWEKPVFAAPAETKYPWNTHATPTVCTDGELVFAEFGAGIACLDFDGRLLWKELDLEWVNNSVHGAVTSPVIVDDKVIVVKEKESDRERPSTITAYFKESGQRSWSIHTDQAYDSYSTPVLFKNGGSTELVTLTSDAIISYDVDSGEQLWTHEVAVTQPVPSMIVADDVLYLSGGAHGRGASGALRLDVVDRTTVVSPLWMTQRSPPDMSSPVLYEGKLFSIKSSGIMICYNAKDGQIIWKKRLKVGSGDYLSSLAACDGRVFVCRTDGKTTVISATADKFELLAENELAEPIWSSPSIAHDCLFIRTANSLYCIAAESE